MVTISIVTQELASFTVQVYVPAVRPVMAAVLSPAGVLGVLLLVFFLFFFVFVFFVYPKRISKDFFEKKNITT